MTGEVFVPSQAPIVGAAFWIFIACVVVAGIWFAYAKKKETQKTIRTAIEKGIQLDDALLDRLVVQESGNPDDYYIGGIICLAVAIGMPILGYFVGQIAPEAFPPLMGAGALVALIGGSLILCGWLIDRRGKAAKNGDHGM